MNHPHWTQQQYTHFRQNGHISCTPPFDPTPLLESLSPNTRDLWRKNPTLESALRRHIAPLALQLQRRSSLRLLTDLYLPEKPPEKRLQDLFGFQGMLLFVSLTQEELSFFDPSYLVEKLPLPSYLAAFGPENSRLVANTKDPHLRHLKTLGYAYGDKLQNATHPLFFL